MSVPDPQRPDAEPDLLWLAGARHLRNGWLGMLLFVSLGIALESLHAFKSATYLGPANETRRLMWTLAHAHGVGLSLLQIAFAMTLRAWSAAPDLRLATASISLNVATALLPLGFFLGGIAPYEGDPGLGVWLVPLGALALLIGVACVAWSAVHRTR